MAGIPHILQAMTMISYLFFHWKGAMNHESIQFKIFVNRNHIATVNQWYLVYFEDGTQDLISKELPIVKTLAPIGIKLENLKPLTKYKYFFYFDKISSLKVEDIPTKYQTYHFTTLQLPYQKQNLSFSFSSCAKTGSDDHVFTDIMELFPDHQFFVQMGDIFYSDITENNEILFDECKIKFQELLQNL